MKKLHMKKYVVVKFNDGKYKIWDLIMAILPGDLQFMKYWTTARTISRPGNLLSNKNRRSKQHD
jgi:hypothetical protein